MHGLPAGLYTCLSGFLEPGETVEEAVAREVRRVRRRLWRER
jgi:NADH pyrophosphatase NudC (nudix superfamily)